MIAKYGYTQGFLDVYDLVDAAFVHIHNKPEGTKLQLLIDGSGSMSSGRRNSAMISSVILHEVLKKQGIQHAIVEHRQILRKSDGKIPILALQ